VLYGLRSSLFLLAAFQVFPALLFIVVIGFVTALLRPLLMNRIQHKVSDDIRATILSMQSLLFTIVAATAQPILVLIADASGCLGGRSQHSASDFVLEKPSLFSVAARVP
jgi:hypothetical protein